MRSKDVMEGTAYPQDSRSGWVGEVNCKERIHLDHVPAINDTVCLLQPISSPHHTNTCFQHRES